MQKKTQTIKRKATLIAQLLDKYDKQLLLKRKKYQKKVK